MSRRALFLLGAVLFGLAVALLGWRMATRNVPGSLAGVDDSAPSAASSVPSGAEQASEQNISARTGPAELRQGIRPSSPDHPEENFQSGIVEDVVPESPHLTNEQGTRPDLVGPGEAMLDAARFLVSRYEPAPQGGRLDLRLQELVERYAPEELPPGMAYAVSPAAMRLVYMLTAARFAELLRQEALERLSPAATRDFLNTSAAWLQGLSACPAALAEGRPELAAPLDGDDCVGSLERIRGLLVRENRDEVEATAGELLQRLASALERDAAKLAANTGQ